ncbi:MAG: SBBP repeat-containing protein [Candidatus Schekmanbacteria bacterium]|nr:SBBP repeat-containing protein [Candidatus Schekmanbacteria bacterium]
MGRKSILFIIVFSILLIPFITFANTQPDTSKVLAKAAKLQIPFIENKGQVQDKSVRFYANTFAGNVFVTDKGEIVYGLVNGESFTPLRETLIGTIPSTIKGESKSATQVNYFVGNKENWKSNISTWDSVNLGEVYEGVELKLKAYGQNVEKLFYVNECGDVDDIKLTFDGAEDIFVNESGELEVETELGTVKFTKPFAYQELDGKKIEVKCNFIVPSSTLRGEERGEGELSYGFQVASYDKNYPLVIDPSIVYFGTFGGGVTTIPYDVTLDNSGNVYITGQTYGTLGDFPLISPLYSYNKGDSDVFVLKINASGTALVYSTFIGGTGVDVGYGIAVDSSENIYITGSTTSSNFPLMSPIQALKAGTNDAFITKINSSGTSLIYSTYLGGSNSDYCTAIAVDNSGNAYVTGNTNSTNFPLSSPLQGSFGGGSYDAFLTKINSSGNVFVYSTYLGGSDWERGNSIAVDSAGNAYVTGSTQSTNFPIYNAFQSTMKDNNGYYSQHAFITKINSSGTTFIFSTYFGGTFGAVGKGIAVDSYGNIYVGGETFSYDLPVTNYLSNPFPMSTNAFVSKFDTTGATLLYSTFFGGSWEQTVNDIAIDGGGNIYIVGSTYSYVDFPVYRAFQPQFNNTSGLKDGFVSKINPATQSFEYSSYLGSYSYGVDNVAYGVAASLDGTAYVAGVSGLPRINSPSGLNGGDAFIAKIADIPTAITLSLFEINQHGKKVLLTWQTATEIDNLGFNILRSETADGQYVKINNRLIKAKGSSTKGVSYKFKDKNIEAGKTYFYKLEDIDSNTGPNLSDAVKVKVTARKGKEKKK